MAPPEYIYLCLFLQVYIEDGPPLPMVRAITFRSHVLSFVTLIQKPSYCFAITFCSTTMENLK